MGVISLIFLGFLAIGSIQGAPQKDVWAVLVAGSNGWWNYRHQADICHAYHLLIKNGIPADRIITMMYDDIANDSSNPAPGKIINKPGGNDVYGGVKIDYKGDDVNVANFLSVLSGNKDAVKNVGSGRVLESTSESDVFINFADHGGAGILCFPNENLYADDLEKTLRGMVEGKKFKKLLMYIEACEAGSMFDNILEENNNILVSTASAPDESSYGWYCEESTYDDNCLGDLYSITWMEHMDQLPADVMETVFHQYNAVRTATLQKSHVNLYGDFRVGFDGLKSSSHKPFVFNVNSFNSTSTGVNNRDIPLHVTKSKMLKAKDPLTRKHFQNKLVGLQKAREAGDRIMRRILTVAANGNKQLHKTLGNERLPLSKNMFPCYKTLISEFNKHCFHVNKNTYFLQHMYKFANLCIAGVDTERVAKRFSAICSSENQKFDLIL